MPSKVSNVKLTLKKEKAKPDAKHGVYTAWSGDSSGDWKATVTCDIELSEEYWDHEVVITLYGIAESSSGVPTGSWEVVHRFHWSVSVYGKQEYTTVNQSEKNFSRHNYLHQEDLNVNKGFSVVGWPPRKIVPRPERIRASVFLRAHSDHAESDALQIKV